MTKMKNDVLRVDDVIKHFIFPYFLKKTVVFHKPQRLKCNVTCFPRIIFPYFFKPQRLKSNVICFPHIIFPYFFKPQRLKCNVACFPRIIFPYFFKNKSSFTKKPTTFENTTLLPISLNCLH